MPTNLGDRNQDATPNASSTLRDLTSAVGEAERLIRTAEAMLDRAYALLAAADDRLERLIPARTKQMGQS